MSSSNPFYTPVIVPELHRIQKEFGYLQREALERFSKDSQIPLAKIQAVASFFPHFQLSLPKPVTVRVCRDMACRMSGSAQLLADLASSSGDSVTVQGVSCLGRCDRAPAVSLSLKDGGHDHYLLARSTENLRAAIAQSVATGTLPHSDHDADLPINTAFWRVDPYSGKTPDYLAVRQALAARDASLATATTFLHSQSSWSLGRLESFRSAAVGQTNHRQITDPAVNDAVLDWQTETAWAQGPTLGGWADPLLEELKAGDLRGMGGAGIPAIQKWRDVRDAVRVARRRKEDDRAFIVVNGDESEPGTFKDRELLLRLPHLIVESVILAGLLTEASQGFIYIRHEYHEQIAACQAEILRAESLGLCGNTANILGRPFPVSVFASPGGYICGEQSALIEAMSDRRGEPRNMPPKLETNGLLDLPTLVSNVETFAWAPLIITRSGKSYADSGTNGWKGSRIFSVSGDVKKPGVYEVPMGLTLRELLTHPQFCAGILHDLPLKAVAPSGPSGGFLPAKLTATAGLPRDHSKNKQWLALAARRGFSPEATELDLLDLELELNLFRALSPTQALGAGIVIYAEGRNMAEEALNSLEFFRSESCGKCVPCRLGSQKFVSIATHLLEGKITALHWQNQLFPLINELGKAIELASICGLGRSVPVPLRTVANFFPNDLATYLLNSPNQSLS